MKDLDYEGKAGDRSDDGPTVKQAREVYRSKGHKSFEKYQRARVLHPRFEGRTWTSLTTDERRPFEQD